MAVFALVVLPLLVVGLAALAATVTVTGSRLELTQAGVLVRNYPQPAVTYPLDRVVRFEPVAATGTMTFVRPRTAVLVLADGTRVPVRRPRADGAGIGVPALNARLEQLRAG